MNNVFLIGSLVFCLIIISIQSLPSEMHTEDAYAADGFFHRAYNNGYKQGLKDSSKGQYQKRLEGNLHKPHPLHPQQYYHPEVQFNQRTEHIYSKDRYGMSKTR